MAPETTTLQKPEPQEKMISGFSFPALRLPIRQLTDETGKLRLRRLCLQFLQQDGEFSLVAYKMDRTRKWMDLAKSQAKKIDEGKKISSFMAAPKMIKLEKDPGSSEVIFLQGDGEVMFPQLELSRRQLDLLIRKTSDKYIRFTPKKGVINPDYVFYDAATTSSTEVANPCPPYPSESAS